MEYRSLGKLDWKPSALGFGCMRLPVMDGDASQIDENQAANMLHYAIDQGVNYIDTAYPYHGGNSENFLGRILQGDYRDRVKLATKLPSWKIQQPEDFDRYLNEQLSKLQTERIDFYLLHALNEKYWQQIQQLDVLNWLEKAKADGRIARIGFSFHDDFDVFKKIVDAYQDWDFCLIQYNFVDRNYQAGQKGLRYAAERGMGVVIMEPLRGGRLVEPPPAVQNLWDSADNKRTPAEWAFQWLWNQPEVSLVLSGMSTMQQVEENLQSASRSAVGALTAREIELIDQVWDTYQSMSLIPCTRCGYCVPCPEGVDIPRILHIYNDGIVFDKLAKAASEYTGWVPDDKKADLCVVCGECQEQCPQDIAIPDWLEKIHAEFIESAT